MSTIKILCFAILGMVTGGAACIQQTEAIDEEIAVELKAAIENNTFQVITLTRTSSIPNMKFLLPREIVYLFQKLSECFVAELPSELKSPFLKEFTSMLEQIETVKDNVGCVDIDSGFKWLLREKGKY